MADDFENHCWKDIVPPDVLDIYSHYHRKTFVGPSPALLATSTWKAWVPSLLATVSAIVLVAESLFALAGSLCAQAVGKAHSANGSNT